ncbi:phage holin family protein [Xanthomarina sp. F1114]|uniref:phage holin family protein n=1 Tax=Xanthomarina sp. F1114 TaxID=2996019 RepID=UPI00225E6B10|nr:phage holin family protein [Xanthomarina sp. F1114]MCX7546756.1 phage holin family protein [Xanthomarina sp. F1114]
MNLIIRILLTAVAVVVLAYLLPGVYVEGYGAAVIVAVVLGLLDAFVKPLLVVLTLPITVITLGFFLLVINALIILMANKFISGFTVDGFWIALLFSFLLSILQSILFSVLKDDVN